MRKSPPPNPVAAVYEYIASSLRLRQQPGSQAAIGKAVGISREQATACVRQLVEERSIEAFKPPGKYSTTVYDIPDLEGVIALPPAKPVYDGVHLPLNSPDGRQSELWTAKTDRIARAAGLKQEGTVQTLARWAWRAYDQGVISKPSLFGVSGPRPASSHEVAECSCCDWPFVVSEASYARCVDCLGCP